jgi:hypothetical protein
VQRAAPGRFGGLDERRLIEVGPTPWQLDYFVGGIEVGEVTVRSAGDRYRLDAHATGGAQDARGNLSAIGDE